MTSPWWRGQDGDEGFWRNYEVFLLKNLGLGASFYRELTFDKEMFRKGDQVFDLKSNDSIDFDGGNMWEFKRLRALKINKNKKETNLKTLQKE